MSQRALDSRHSVDSCAFQLHSWRPFQLPSPTPKTLDPDPYSPTKPYSKAASNGSPTGGGGGGAYSKRPCRADRATSSFSLERIDMSRLSLFDDDCPLAVRQKRGKFRWVDRKRRRRGSRSSVSGRSSDRSGTRRCCSVGASAAYATCSDFPVAAGQGTDSSGELFVNGEGSWAMDVVEGKGLRRDRDGERENLGSGFGQSGSFDALGNESGYGSEPGYRGDAEFGYGDEVEEEEDDPRPLFWGDRGGGDANMGIAGEKTFSEQKIHHRGRRKKQDWRIFDPMR